MIILRLLLLLTNLHLKLLSTQGTGADKLLSTQRVKSGRNLTQILNFKANFHTEFEPFFKKKIYADNGGHFKIVSIKIKNKFCPQKTL